MFAEPAAGVRERDSKEAVCTNSFSESGHDSCYSQKKRHNNVENEKQACFMRLKNNSSAQNTCVKFDLHESRR